MSQKQGCERDSAWANEQEKEILQITISLTQKQNDYEKVNDDTDGCRIRHRCKRAEL